MKETFPKNLDSISKFSKSNDLLNVNNNEKTLKSVLQIMEVLANWLIKSGIGYSEFVNHLRIIFYNQSIIELDNISQKKTDSSISLLSGLPRREISQLRHENNGHNLVSLNTLDTSISVPARVIGLWISRKIPSQIPFSNSNTSFENLVKEVSRERHPRSILEELKRLGVVNEDESRVILEINSFTPSPETDEVNKLFTSNVCDLISAGIENITTRNNKFIEQAIYADELTEKSIDTLKELSYDLWEIFSNKILLKAIECCKEDEGRKDATKRFKLGIYEYHEDVSSID